MRFLVCAGNGSIFLSGSWLCHIFGHVPLNPRTMRVWLAVSAGCSHYVWFVWLSYIKFNFLSFTLNFSFFFSSQTRGCSRLRTFFLLTVLLHHALTHACSNTTLSLSRKIERDSCSRSHATHHSSTASAHHHATMQSTSLLSLEFVFILFLFVLIHFCCTLKIKEKCEKSITVDPLLTPFFLF